MARSDVLASSVPAAPSPSTTAERALIRYAFMVRFGQAPSLADGIWLKVWRAGERSGQPKVPPAVASMVARGLVEVQAGVRLGAKAVFTPASLVALRELAWGRRALDPGQYGHLLAKLGVAAG